MTPAISATIFAACAVLPIIMQIALACGAPIGRFANGGLFPGRLPPLWRALAVVQGLLLAAMAWAMLARGGVIGAHIPGPAFWGALALSFVTMVANLISRSRPERLLWGPVTTLMFVSALGVAFL